MNCIIVADKSSCILLEEFVMKSSSLNLIGTFNDSVSARNQLLERQDIDLMILDIQKLGIEGFEFISSLDSPPNFIIVSSDEEHALKAFDFNAIDYLLKPVTYSRFFRAIDKAIRYYSPKEVNNSSHNNEIFIKKGSELIRLKHKDIIYIEALENYITLNTIDDKITILYTMKAIEDQLPSSIFIRVQRSFIVNKDMIQTIHEDSLNLKVGNTLKNIPVGKSFRDRLLKTINLMVR